MENKDLLLSFKQQWTDRLGSVRRELGLQVIVNRKVVITTVSSKASWEPSWKFKLKRVCKVARLTAEVDKFKQNPGKVTNGLLTPMFGVVGFCSCFPFSVLVSSYFSGPFYSDETFLDTNQADS